MQPGEFITSDTHFGHANVILHAGRPFSSAEHMDRELIARWNAKVPQNAVIYHLGDLALASPTRVREILAQLNGRIRFFPGNHDSWMVTKSDAGQGPRAKFKDIADRFEWFRPFSYHETKGPGDIRVIMSHYAFDVWNRSHHGTWHLHGHSHGSLPEGGRIRMDVGVDCHPNYEPFSFEEVRAHLSGRTPYTPDHHKSRKAAG